MRITSLLLFCYINFYWCKDTLFLELLKKYACSLNIICSQVPILTPFHNLLVGFFKT